MSRTRKAVETPRREPGALWARLVSALRLDERGDLRSWAIVAVAGVAAYSAASQGLVSAGERWQLPLFVGCVVGAVALIPWQGAVVAFASVLGGMLVVPPFLLFGATPGVTGYVLAAVLSPMAGVAPGIARSLVAGDMRKRLTLAMSVVLVAWTLVNFWMPLFSEGPQIKGYGALSAATFREAPAPGAYANDEAFYRRIYTLLHAGESYYPAYREAWLGMSHKPALPGSPVGYRLPTYFWLWSLLPADPFSAVYLFLVFASAGIVAAAWIAGQLVGPRLAPIAALALAAYALDVGMSTYVVFLDLPAMSIALIGVGFFVWGARTGRTSALWAAAGMLVLAALTREFLVYLLVFAALSALLERRGERLARATPWLAGLAVFAAGYLAHAIASQPYLAAGSNSVTYFNGGIGYFADALSRFSGSYAGGAAALVLLVLMGLAGAYASRWRAGVPFAAFACACIVVPLASMLVFGNPGRDVSGVGDSRRPACAGPLAGGGTAAREPRSRLGARGRTRVLRARRVVATSGELGIELGDELGHLVDAALKRGLDQRVIVGLMA